MTPVAARRIAPIDIARGSAMVLVFLAHYLQEVMSQVANAAARPGFRALEALTNAAAPAFLLISGMTLAFTLEGLSGDALKVRRRVVLDRALFMLVVGHLFLTVTDALLASGQRPVGQVFITDTIALALMAGAYLLPQARAPRLMGLAAALLALGWLMYLHWRPATPLLQGIASALGGPTGTGPVTYAFPVLAWTAVFLVGAIVGQSLARALAEGRSVPWARRVMLASVILIVAGVVVRLTARRMALTPAVDDMLSLSARMPPGPPHLMIFGGLAMIILAAAFMLHGEGPASALLSTLGRASFFVFLLQSLVYRDLVSRLPLTAPWTWVLAFVASVALLWWASRAWDRAGWNRFLTFRARRTA